MEKTNTDDKVVVEITLSHLEANYLLRVVMRTLRDSENEGGDSDLAYKAKTKVASALAGMWDKLFCRRWPKGGAGVTAG